MPDFLSNHRLYLTPLSPIHIGCSEDFEPTNYIIEKGLLYGFDPSRAILSEEQLKALTNISKTGNLPSIQAFFRKNAESFKSCTQTLIPVCKGVADLYEQRLGRAANVQSDGKVVFNRLEIERHIHTGENQWPFIPGSSFKGALRTAWVNDLNQGRRPRLEDYVKDGTAKLEKRLLEGDFETSPLRLLKISDLMPSREPQREIVFAVNRKKRLVILGGKEVQSKGIATRKECVLGGQYRLYEAEATLPSLHSFIHDANPFGGVSNKGLAPNKRRLTAEGRVDLQALARQSHDYHLRLLLSELKTLNERGLVSPDWMRSIESLFLREATLESKLKEGSAFLVRIGRFGGAESKTLSGGVAQIKIMGARGQHPTYETTTKTVWLAAQRENEQKHLIPFGWAIVEIDPQGDCKPLLDWCQQQGSEPGQERPNTTQMLKELKEKYKADKTRMSQERARKEAERVEQEALESSNQARLAQMTECGRRIEALRKEIEEFSAKLVSNSKFKKQEGNPNKAGLYQRAAQLVEAALKEGSAWSEEEKSALADMLQAMLPKVIAGWSENEKEHRKKLKFAKLRGQA